MTKLKSKKMTKSAFAVVIMAIAMVALLAFGGTYAYFTSKVATPVEGSVTAGHVEIAMGENKTITSGALEEFAVPGDTLWTVNLDIDNKSNVKTYIFATWTYNANGAVLTVSNVADGWTPLDGEEGVYYKAVDASTDVTFGASVLFATSNGNNMQDKTFTCSVSFASAQFNFMEPADAYAAAIA